MKVRIKVSGSARAVDVGDGESCTLAQLKNRAADALQLQTPFSLSLNKTDQLSGDDQTLTQLGIVPGDLLYVINSISDSSSLTRSAETAVSPSRGTESTQETTATASTSASSVDSGGESAGLRLFQMNDLGLKSDSAHNVSRDGLAARCYAGASQVEESRSSESTSEPENSGVIVTQTPSSPPDASSSTTNAEAAFQHSSVDNQNGVSDLPPSPSPLQDPEVNRCLQEPLMCRESTASAVPALLQNLYASAGCRKPTEALWVVVHSLIMETGFRPVQDNDLAMDAGWNSHAVYKQTYTYLSVQSMEHNCTVMGVPMGATLLVHGFTSDEQAFKTERLHLRVSDYVLSVHQDVRRVYSNLDRLSRWVKDGVCQPLLAHFGEVCGFPVTLGLLSLSHELKLKVLSYLPAESLVTVAQVCRLFGAIYKDPWLWRRLYLREFGRNGDNSLSKDWYTLYKEEWLLRRERRKAARMRQQVVLGIPPWLNPRPGPFTPIPPPPFPGGIIGGDYDFNPEFTSNIPHPLFNNPRVPGPHLPHPRFEDPFAGPPEDLFNPGPARPSLPGPRFGTGQGSGRPSPFGPFGNRFI